MATIEEELKAAKAAKAAIGTNVVATLRNAVDIARRAQITTFSSEVALNDARHNVSLALPPVILSKVPNQPKTRSIMPRMRSRLG